jgi:hypothetical protein
MTASMSRDAADQILAGLSAAHDRIAAAMFAIDSHAGLDFLRNSVLAGRTAARWDTLRSEVDLLWAHFAVLSATLERARGIRGERRRDDARWAELTRLLQDPTVGLDAAGLPAEGSGGPPADWVRLWDLAYQLEQRCAGVASQLSDVGSAWSAVASRLAPLSEAVDAASALAVELGVPTTVDHLRRRLAQVQGLDLSDPLAAARGGRLGSAAQARLRELDTEVTATRDRLTDLARLREGYPHRIAALRGLADEVATAEQSVAEANARAVAKIAEPGLRPAPATGAVLRSRIAELDRLGRQAEWDGLAAGLATAEQSARAALERATRLRAVADGLLDRRGELRGRLDAYRAKAAASGLAEHGELTARYEQAHALLFTAPCDLRGATQAVLAYQQILASLLEESR